MKYMGSKNRIAKHILPIMVNEAEKRGITTWVEPFVGGGNMIDKVPDSFDRIGYDLNEHTIMAMIDIRDKANDLPDVVSEEEYKELRGLPPQSVGSWIRFVCSFGGKFEDGFAREKPESKAALKRGFVRNHAAEGKRNAIRQSPKIQGVNFIHVCYQDLQVFDSIIYCDPPYRDARGYKTGKFNHDQFFDWCRNMTKNGNVVFVSEYNAPDDFECVWQGEVKTNFASNRAKATHKAVEKLFVLAP